MTTTAPPGRTARRCPRPSHPMAAPKGRRASARGPGRSIAALELADGPARELIARRGAAGSTLLIDREASTGADERLIAHLAADEPPGNAALICSLYAATAPESRRCRRVTESDATAVPEQEATPVPVERTVVLAARGAGLRIEPLPSRMSIPELRWTIREPGATGARTVSLRDAIAAIEGYEPLCAITRGAIARHTPDPGLSTTTLRSELTRVLESPIVLNRGLREAVLARVEREGWSLSEIAIRCGRVKRDSRGGQSGETSWLARRIGVLPEGGQSEPTVWVHSDVLALIAREGLGISPREVELA